MTSQTVHYFPFMEGHYRVSVGLHKIQTDFGNGDADRHCIQLDRSFTYYREQKLIARRERPDKYIQIAPHAESAINEAIETLIRILTKEYPSRFHLRQVNDRMQLECIQSGEILTFNHTGLLTDCVSDAHPPYLNSLDAIACQIQEDIAIVTLDRKEGEHVCALHLCFPNYWSAEEKIGKSFLAVHDPVPGFERLEKNADRVLNSLVNQGPFVRFAWGLTTDTRLNHHPVPPQTTTGQHWYGRRFNAAAPELYIRVERQVTLPLPHSNSFIFLIRTYFEEVSGLANDTGKIHALSNAILDMNQDTLLYKGIADQRDEILTWLAHISNKDTQ